MSRLTGRLPGADKTGPVIDDVLEAGKTSETDDELEHSLLHDLATDMQTNRRALAHKGLLLKRAQTFLLASIFLEMAGRVVR